MAKIPFTSKIEPHLLERLRQVAREENRSVSNLMETAAKQYVEKNRKQEARDG
jgi:predicted transcriptional regulator